MNGTPVTQKDFESIFTLQKVKEFSQSTKSHTQKFLFTW